MKTQLEICLEEINKSIDEALRRHITSATSTSTEEWGSEDNVLDMEKCRQIMEDIEKRYPSVIRRARLQQRLDAYHFYDPYCKIEREIE
jgi:GTP1/Obg family GTP-binding protein